MPYLPQGTPAAAMGNPALYGAQGVPMMMPQQTGLAGMTGPLQPGLQVPPTSMHPGMAPLLHQQGVMPQQGMFYQQGLVQGGPNLPYQQGIAQTVSTQAVPQYLQATSQGVPMQYPPQLGGALPQTPLTHTQIQPQQQGVVPQATSQPGVIMQPQAPPISSEVPNQVADELQAENEMEPPAINLDTFPGQIPSTDDPDKNIVKDSKLEQDSVVETTPIPTPRRTSSRKRSEDIRSYVLGPLEDQFDALMEEVRDTDPDDHLQKVCMYVCVCISTMSS